MIGKSDIDPDTLSETELDVHNKSEQDVQDCILAYPSELLCEDEDEEIFLIGKEIKVGGRDERIDILGLDSELNTVVVEIKTKTLNRDHLKQALKYAPYVANRTEENLRKDYQFDSAKYRNKLSADKRDAYYATDFQTAYKQFSQADSLNSDQRIILVGTGARRDLMDVVDWLETQGLTIEVIELTPYEDASSGEIVLTGNRVDSDEIEERTYAKWERSEEEAKEYHLDNRTSEQTESIAHGFVDGITAIERLRDPDYNQKNYISFSDNERIRVKVRPRTDRVSIWLTGVSADDYNVTDIVDELGQDVEITANDASDRIEFVLGPDEGDVIEPLCSFIYKELQ